MKMELNNLIHGRETYVVYYGDSYILKRPLPTTTDTDKAKWLAKQHATKEIIDEIRAVKNPVYNIPAMVHIHDDEYQILEERAHGQPLTADTFSKLNRRQKFEIATSLASFLVDMNEVRPIGDITTHKISQDIKFERLQKFIANKMSMFFNADEVKTMESVSYNLGNFEYETRLAWSHGDLNPGNILYNPETSKISFIDFADAGYHFIYRDIFGPVSMELGIYKKVYEIYTQIHNKKKYLMPSAKNDELREIMKYRMIGVCLKRFIKASDDLRVNPANEKSVLNNANKVAYMRKQIEHIMGLESQLKK